MGIRLLVSMTTGSASTKHELDPDMVDVLNLLMRTASLPCDYSAERQTMKFIVEERH